MVLIYINEIGIDFKGQKQYEFIFSNSDEIKMDEWFTIPASSTEESKSPDLIYIDSVGLLKDTDLNLELIQYSDYFGVIDAVDGIIALGWERTSFEEENERLFFKFGEDIQKVTEKLKSRNFKLII